MPWKPELLAQRRRRFLYKLDYGVDCPWDAKDTDFSLTPSNIWRLENVILSHVELPYYKGNFFYVINCTNYRTFCTNINDKNQGMILSRAETDAAFRRVMLKNYNKLNLGLITKLSGPGNEKSYAQGMLRGLLAQMWPSSGDDWHQTYWEGRRVKAGGVLDITEYPYHAETDSWEPDPEDPYAELAPSGDEEEIKERHEEKKAKAREAEELRNEFETKMELD